MIENVQVGYQLIFHYLPSHTPLKYVREQPQPPHISYVIIEHKVIMAKYWQVFFEKLVNYFVLDLKKVMDTIGHIVHHIFNKTDICFF